jgi:hypothetical protein
MNHRKRIRVLDNREDIQLGIFAKNLHHSVAIKTHTLTQISGLIRETHLKCVEGIRCVLN